MSILSQPSRRARRRAAGGAGRSRAGVAHLPRRLVIPVAVLWGLASAGFAIAISVGAPEPQLAGRLYAATTAAAVLAVLIAKLDIKSPAETGPRFDELLAPRGSDEAEMPLEVELIEQSIRFASLTAGDLHTRLRPVLRQVAAHRLAARHVALDAPAHREAAEAILGPVTFDLVRADRPGPNDRFAPGARPESIEHAIETLEGLG